jgi:hypothetical protein
VAATVEEEVGRVDGSDNVDDEEEGDGEDLKPKRASNVLFDSDALVIKAAGCPRNPKNASIRVISHEAKLSPKF